MPEIPFPSLPEIPGLEFTGREAPLGVDEENPSGARNLYGKMELRVTGWAAFYRKEL